jgi:hypothetical protein
MAPPVDRLRLPSGCGEPTDRSSTAFFRALRVGLDFVTVTMLFRRPR